MPRYYFHIGDGRELRDEVGTELPGPADARTEGLLAAAGILHDVLRHWSGTRWSMHVEDETGEKVFTLTLCLEDHRQH